MTQPTRTSRKGPQSAQHNPLPGVLAAIVVVCVFVVLGLMLAGGPPQPAPVAEQPTAVPLEIVPTVAPAAPTAAADTPAVQTYSAAPPMTIDPTKTYIATITTPRGDIVIKLRPDLAPETVNNFVFLAREKFYDGLTWHRVLENFMAQGGDPQGTGGGGPGYTIKDEFNDTMKFDRPGLLAMARTPAPNSAGSQFFITTAAAPWLDGQYTIFGEVIQGQEIVNGIPLRNPDENPATPGEQMLKVTITEE
jgi:peptidylprolyl isomerase